MNTPNRRNTPGQRGSAPGRLPLGLASVLLVAGLGVALHAMFLSPGTDDAPSAQAPQVFLPPAAGLAPPAGVAAPAGLPGNGAQQVAWVQTPTGPAWYCPQGNSPGAQGGQGARQVAWVPGPNGPSWNCPQVVAAPGAPSVQVVALNPVPQAGGWGRGQQTGSRFYCPRDGTVLPAGAVPADFRCPSCNGPLGLLQ